MKTTTTFAFLAAAFPLALLLSGLSATPAQAQETKLTADDAAAGHNFGRSVAISGNTALVGAFADDDAGFDSGSAYLYTNIPEPSSLLLAILAGLFGLGTTGRRRGDFRVWGDIRVWPCVRCSP